MLPRTSTLLRGTSLALIAALLALPSLGCSKDKRPDRKDEREDDASSRDPSSPGRGSSDAAGSADPIFPGDDISSLPPSTLSVRRFRTSYYSNASANFREPRTEESAWSRLASDICGGLDVYLYMVSSGTWKDGGKSLGRAIKAREKTRQQLACGKAGATSLGPFVHRIRLPQAAGVPRFDEPVPSSVYIAAREMSLEAFPATEGTSSPTHLAPLEHVLCVTTSWDKDCTKDTTRVNGKVAGKPTWLSGEAKPTQRLATYLVGDKQAHPRAKDLTSLARKVAPFFAAEVGVAPAFNLAFVQGLGVSYKVTTAIEKEPFSAALEKALLTRSVAYGFGDRVNPKGGEMKIVFQPQDESAVDGLLSDVKQYRRDMVAYLADRKEAETPEGAPKVEADYLKLLQTWGIRSIEEAKIERDGATVVIDFERRITLEERAIVYQMERLNTRRAERGAELVRLLLDGKDPPATLFEGIGSEAFAGDVAKSRE